MKKIQKVQIRQPPADASGYIMDNLSEGQTPMREIYEGITTVSRE